MIYNKLITKDFINTIVPQKFNEKTIIKALEQCYKICAFSTFPYILHNYNSLDSIKKTNSGNCIALSLFIKLYLEKTHTIYSYLIPATIPNKYKYPGYLDISHVALAIPLNKNIIYIVDPAFYFLNPIIINIKTMSCTTVFSKSIYNHETSNSLKNYSTIDTIQSCPKQTNEAIVFNQYQTINKGTYYANSYFKNDVSDNWCYFLTELINADEAITTFFIGIKYNPFITTTFIDKNGVCTADYYIKLTSSYLELSKYSGERKKYTINEITPAQINDISHKMKGFFQDNLVEYINRVKLLNANKE